MFTLAIVGYIKIDYVQSFLSTASVTRGLKKRIFFLSKITSILQYDF